MRKFFIYYSLTGNGKFLASVLEQHGYIPVQLEMKKEIKKVGFFTILKYGGRAMFNKKEKLKPYYHEFEEGDEFIIGSPIWNDRLSTPILTLLKEQFFDKEKTQFILYPAGEGTKKSKKQLMKLGYTKEPLVINQPLKDENKTKELINELIEKTAE